MPSTRHAWYQGTWLVLYWAAAGGSLIFLVLALTGSDVQVESLFSVATGALATALGAAMASHLVRRRVADVDFDDATGFMRVVVVGWLVLVLTLVVTVVLATDWGATASVGEEAQASMLGITDSVVAELFGIAALFVVVGEGFGSYRRLLAKAPTPATGPRRPPPSGPPPWPRMPDGTPAPRGPDGRPLLPRR